MKISNNSMGPSTPQLDTSKTGKSAKATKAEGSAKGKSPAELESRAAIKDSTNVNVSPRAQMMSKAKEIAGGADTIDEAKVARLQKLIDDGEYNVDASAIADRLVDEHMLIPD